MIKYRPTTHDHRFTVITVDVDDLDAMIRSHGFPFYIGPEGHSDDRLPWWVQAHHRCIYCDKFAEIKVDGIADRPVAYLTLDDDLADGRARVTVASGLETLAVFRDLRLRQIDIEVPWGQRAQIESLLINQ